MQAWVTPEEVPNAEAFTGIDLSSLCAAASEVLHIRSGRQFGVGTTTVRPSRLDRGCGCGSSYGVPGAGGAVPYPDDYALSSVSPTTLACSCVGSQEIALKGHNPRDLVVKLDGIVLTAGADYRLMSGRRLFRVNGWWPCCQDVALPDTEPGTLSIRYTWGASVPPAGLEAAKALTYEFGLAVTAPEDCHLPARVLQIARSGVTAIVQDPVLLLKEGLTGIPMVDMFLTTYNPTGRRRPAQVISPETIVQYREAPT